MVVLLVQNRSLDLPVSARSAAVARWPPFFAGRARIPPTGRPVRSGLARWFRLYQFSSFSIRSVLLPVPVRLPVPFSSVRSCSLVPLGSSFPLVLVFPACSFACPARFSFRSAWFSVRLVQFRLVFVRISFRSVFVLLSLFCARAFSRAGLFILFSRILYTKRGQRQMNFLSKNMSFLIISVSSLNYPNLEHISPLPFPSNRPSRQPFREPLATRWT